MTKPTVSPNFGNLYLRCICPECKKRLIIDLSNKKILKYGFVCAYCNNIVNASNMWISIIKSENFKGQS